MLTNSLLTISLILSYAFSDTVALRNLQRPLILKANTSFTASLYAAFEIQFKGRA
jgi:hypothetical protein